MSRVAGGHATQCRVEGVGDDHQAVWERGGRRYDVKWVQGHMDDGKLGALSRSEHEQQGGDASEEDSTQAEEMISVGG